jgi:hypothetical protein
MTQKKAAEHHQSITRTIVDFDEENNTENTTMTQSDSPTKTKPARPMWRVLEPVHCASTSIGL